MKKVALALVILVVGLLVTGYVIANKDQGSDQDQILAVIERGRQAIESKSPSDAVSCISKSYKDENMKYDQLRVLISHALTAKPSFEVSVDSPTVAVSGNAGTANTKVGITAIDGDSRENAFSGKVILHLQKEKTRKFIIYSVNEWKITSIDGIGSISSPEKGAESIFGI